MANKPKILGNDPFQRGAAVRGKESSGVANEAPAGQAAATGAAPGAGGTKAGAPKAGAAKADAPKAGVDKADAPKAGVTKTDAPKAGAAKADVPKASVTKTDAPKAGAAKADVPKASVTKTDAPKAGAAKADAPKAGVTNTDAPKAGAAKADAPKAGVDKADVLKANAAKTNAPKAAARTGTPQTISAKTNTPKASAANTDTPRSSPPKPHDEPADLLPDDLAAAPHEPRVQAIPPIAPLHTHGKPGPAQKRVPTDITRGALKALKLLLGLPASAPSFEVDELGRDAAFEEQTRPFFDWVYDAWFRVQTSGLDHLPQTGPVILVANRAGALPWDSLMLSVACQREGKDLRPLVEDDVFHFPSLGVLINRLGAVRACPENARWVLDQGGAIAVFPEGATGFGKPFRERYRLQRFGRGGFVKLALQTGATVIPVSIVGSEEIHPLLAKIPARPLGIPFLPVTPTFPWLGAAGLLPLPTRWYIDVGEPFDLSSHGPEAAADDPLVLRIADTVRGTIQAMLDTRLARRRSIFRG